MKGQSDFALYVSNRIYKPSYISLHTALAFYGIIPEAITQITGVSSLKTAEFQNDFGVYTYKTIKPELMFGYELKPFGNRTIQFAHPEKALLDLLYLYPFYNTEEEMEELRLDEDYLTNDLDIKRLDEYTAQFGNKVLAKRIELMKKTYGI
jgi:predicted transcriptional regulator of viral defense system